MDVEQKIRKMLRNLPITCPCCGSECLSVDEEKDIDCGIVDDIICADCESGFQMVSIVHTELIAK